jgi:hypothetical protein
MCANICWTQTEQTLKRDFQGCVTHTFRDFQGCVTHTFMDFQGWVTHTFEQ